MTEKNEDELALKLLADAINIKRDELINLEASYAKLGGIFDVDEDAAPAGQQKLLPAPKSKAKKAKKKKAKRAVGEPDEFGVTLAGQFVKLRERQAAVVELLIAANGKPVSKAEIIHAWGGPVNFFATFISINNQIAATGLQAVLSPVRGEGYQLQKI